MNDSLLEKQTTIQPLQRDFATVPPAVWIPCMIFLGADSIVGTVGNIFILIAVAKNKYLRTPESIFIVNLACADLYVTMIADSMSTVAKVEGEEFFHHRPQVCRVIAEMCTVACTVSLMTIGGMSFSRYINICHPSQYQRIFTRCRIKIACVIFYFLGSVFVLLNLAGIGSHGFDVKKMECIFQSSHDRTYTVVFFSGVVLFPIVVISVSFILMYRKVVASKAKVCASTAPGTNTSRASQKLAKTLFIIYMTFTLSWLPYAIVSIADARNEFPDSIHLIVVIWAHLHSSANWIVYFKTNRKFNTAFKEIFRKITGRGKPVDETFAFRTDAPPTETTLK